MTEKFSYIVEDSIKYAVKHLHDGVIELSDLEIDNKSYAVMLVEAARGYVKHKLHDKPVQHIEFKNNGKFGKVTYWIWGSTPYVNINVDELKGLGLENIETVDPDKISEKGVLMKKLLNDLKTQAVGKGHIGKEIDKAEKIKDIKWYSISAGLIQNNFGICEPEDLPSKYPGYPFNINYQLDVYLCKGVWEGLGVEVLKKAGFTLPEPKKI